MYKHHQETIDKITKEMRADENVLALIIAGSVAHGFAQADSDVDIMIVVTAQEYEKRQREGKLTYMNREIATYEKGYVDGKYTSVDYIKETGQPGHGYEPGRFAFHNAYVAFSKVPGLEAMIKEAAKYPKALKKNRMKKFYARFREWQWYYNDGMNKNNAYLVSYSIDNMLLFGGRAILAYNELLFPYHKWFLKVLEGAPKKPENLMKLIDDVLATRSGEAVSAFIDAVESFTDWGIKSTEWANFLMSDTDSEGDEEG